jgi:hypothetical protein
VSVFSKLAKNGGRALDFGGALELVGGSEWSSLGASLGWGGLEMGTRMDAT